MISRLLLLALLSADPTPDAGTPLTVASLYAACPDAPLAEPVDGGFYVPLRRAQRESCELAACEAFATPRLAPDGDASPGIVLALISGSVALAAVAAVAGFVAGQATAKK